MKDDQKLNLSLWWTAIRYKTAGSSLISLYPNDSHTNCVCANVMNVNVSKIQNLANQDHLFLLGHVHLHFQIVRPPKFT